MTKLTMKFYLSPRKNYYERTLRAGVYDDGNPWFCLYSLWELWEFPTPRPSCLWLTASKKRFTGAISLLYKWNSNCSYIGACEEKTYITASGALDAIILRKILRTKQKTGKATIWVKLEYEA